MRALIVYAHPEPTSFSAAMLRVAREALEGAGHEVEVSDLYAEGFDPTAGRHDFLDVADPDRFHYQSEQAHAAATGTFAPDIVREQERVARADLLLFVFPLWWGGVPAILKGWFDRVLAYGFAYEDGMRYETGFFRGRRGLLGVVTGGTRHRFSSGGSYGAIEQVLWPTQHCMIEYLGLTTFEPFVAYAAPRVDDAQRAAYLDQWRERVLDAAADELSDPDDRTVPLGGMLR
ncbi:NAD(P)H-dependent oxidoreductase [Cellulomonas fimi]|uniref:NAD(P)H-dependent oxidoreductase n=1 Tax=Cellulomonas fimi TaxID=1708 RepID=A0A7Y0QJI1_CELFI|nr:NAD(P)H-dependent oxidoreductase [Cellulomonas fimi]NMR21362.1 NAD(P)H-dependent oxidoreductase [Cellulomonas fimi]